MYDWVLFVVVIVVYVMYERIQVNLINSVIYYFCFDFHDATYLSSCFDIFML
jgi:hypothetical protein